MSKSNFANSLSQELEKYMVAGKRKRRHEILKPTGLRYTRDDSHGNLRVMVITKDGKNSVG
jgi:hypothetical protein